MRLFYICLRVLAIVLFTMNQADPGPGPEETDGPSPFILPKHLVAR